MIISMSRSTWAWTSKLVLQHIARSLNDYICVQIYMDVDCSDITYDTPPSPTILQAVEKATQRLNATEGLIVSLHLW